VVHVHCVNTIALAIRRDAEAALAARLGGFDWAFVPYAKPGATLAALVRDARGPATDVVVLGNHGLIVAGQNVAEAAALLDRVVAAVAVAPAPSPAPDLDGLEALAAGSAYAVPPAAAPVHRPGLDPRRTAVATGGSLYPDHVIFCGPGALAVEAGAALPGPEGPPFVIVPGLGALVRRDADAGARALADCLGDVLGRLPADASPVYLTPEQDAELMDWDAEKYRKALNAG
jgi:rhamnose utilization protein RhaD (predicted bifunctional aldolase and dehydrogenase)